ncbi:MAG TPA: hydantoinase/oxoprolinase family protein [Gaiellales bacterium]|nr:hydantoinase/oxoprolinase family protein [Gaiellales bacterium]
MSDGQPGRIGIDVGGTFTDAVIVAADGRSRIAKVPSTPERIERGFMDALAELLERSASRPAHVGYLAHGSTVATNAIVQRRLARTALVTNRGFRDVLAIGTQMRAAVYDLWTPEPLPIVPRELCFTVAGRIDAAGEEVLPLDEDSVREAAARLREAGAEAVAVMLLFSFLNPVHELRVGELLAEQLPGVELSLSCQVVPEFREYVRASTTALNAALLPLMGSYLTALAGEVDGAGVRVPIHLMQTNGGVAPAERAHRLPIALSASGPAAGVIGGCRLAELVGEGDALTFDMGGTTADIGLVLDADPQVRFSGEAAGMPINLPQIDVLCIGAGGGSIARVDEFGSLTVGPASAGADPGPAAYGRGGTEATVTDAHVVLGTLSAEHSLAGGVPLDRQRAASAVMSAVGDRLHLDAEAAAEAILRIANANMANALRLMTVARGHDPRRFALVAIGGAGPMHACALADEVGIPRIVIPRFPGVAAALGLLATDIRHDLRRSWLRPTAEITPAELDEELERLEAEAAGLLRASAGVTSAHQLDYELDMRYRGQAYNLTVAFAARPVTAAAIAEAVARFEDEHRRLYDYTPSVTDTEIVTLRLRALARIPAIDWEVQEPAAANGGGRRDVYAGGTTRSWTLVQRAALEPGAELGAETIVEQEDCTTVIPAGWHGRVEAAATLVLEREGSG